MTYNPDIEGDIPQEVQKFLSDLNSAVINREIGPLNALYEKQFEALTKEHYVMHNKIVQWPSPSLPQVVDYFTDDSPLQVYSFIAYKHAFTVSTAQNRIKPSWDTFVALFRYLSQDHLRLPSWMLWDIFDEFAYQVSAVHQSDYVSQSGEWTIAEAQKLLDAVIESSNMAQVLASSDADDITKAHHTRALSGFFAVIAKSKIHMLMGDYYAALSGLEPISIYEAGNHVIQRVSPARISTFYLIGFSYLMIHRYEDASSGFHKCFTVKINGRKFSERTQQDAIYLYICARVLGGMGMMDLRPYIDQNRNKSASFDETREALQNGDEDRFGEVFERCSPKFIAAVSSGAGVRCTDGKEQQIRMFRRAVQQQQDLIKLRGYFGIYQNTKVGLFETHLDTDDGFSPLFALKMRSRQLVHDGRSANLLSGEFKISVQCDCIVTDDNVKVVHTATFGGMEARILKKIRNINYDLKHLEQARMRSENNQEEQANGNGNAVGKNNSNTNQNSGGGRKNNNNNAYPDGRYQKKN